MKSELEKLKDEVLWLKCINTIAYFAIFILTVRYWELVDHINTIWEIVSVMRDSINVMLDSIDLLRDADSGFFDILNKLHEALCQFIK